MIYTPRFRHRIERIHDYISDVLNSPPAADRIIDSIIIDCELLEHNPHRGMMSRSGKKKYIGMRYVISGKYLVPYKIDQNRVIISSN